MTYSDSLRWFIQRWEVPGGTPMLEPHWDAIGQVWDIGYSHVIQEGEERRSMTADEVEMLFDWDLHFYDDGVSAAVTVPLAQCQYDAMVAFTYNVGLGAFNRSKMLRCLNAEDFVGAMDEHAGFNKAKGNVVRGLVNRRAAERAMFELGEYRGP